MARAGCRSIGFTAIVAAMVSNSLYEHGAHLQARSYGVVQSQLLVQTPLSAFRLPP